jgi:hypothetical protein
MAMSSASTPVRRPEPATPGYLLEDLAPADLEVLRAQDRRRFAQALPEPEPEELREYTLEELLAQVTDENWHPETDWGRPVGREAW